MAMAGKPLEFIRARIMSKEHGFTEKQLPRAAQDRLAIFLSKALTARRDRTIGKHGMNGVNRPVSRESIANPGNR